MVIVKKNNGRGCKYIIVKQRCYEDAKLQQVFERQTLQLDLENYLKISDFREEHLV